MASGNLDALSAIATVLNPNMGEDFSGNALVDGTVILVPADAELVDGTYTLSAEMIQDPDAEAEAVDDPEAEAETYCDLDESTKEAGQTLEPRLIGNELKTSWQAELDSNGAVACSVPGCQMRYSTIVSFERHYKWCTGEKGEGVETCEYCSLPFLRTLLGIEYHVKKEHASEINDYTAKRVAKKIIKECREKEQKAREQKEAKALELKRERQNSRGTYQRRQTCYSKKQPVRSDSDNSKDSVDKKVRFKQVVSVIHPEKSDENEEANVDDPLAFELNDESERSKRPLNRPKEAADVIKLARNWGVQRKTYSRSGAASETGSSRDLFASDSDLFNEPNSSALSETEVSDASNTLEKEMAEDQPVESELTETLMEVEEQQVVTFFNSDLEESVIIPIETEGCITIGEAEEQEDENYQLVIVTGESGESQYIVLDESLSQALAEGATISESNELQTSENSAFNVVTMPDEELVSVSGNIPETVEEGVGEEPNTMPEDSIAVEIVQESEDLHVESSENILHEAVDNCEVVDNAADLAADTIIIEGEPNERSIVMDPTTLSKATTSRGGGRGRKPSESKKVMVKTRTTKNTHAETDSEDSKDRNADRFQLQIPKNLSSINIGDDFLPKNIDKLLDFGSGRTDKLPKKSEMLSQGDGASKSDLEDSENLNGSWTNYAKSTGNSKERNIPISSSNLFDKLAKKDRSQLLLERTTQKSMPGHLPSRSSPVATNQCLTRASASPQVREENDVAMLKHKKLQLTDETLPLGKGDPGTVATEIRIINPAKDGCLSSLQGITGLSGNPHIKIYTPNSDGTLAPLEDFSILSSNPQIRIMTPERDGTLKPMIVGDQKLILKSVQKMIATGASSGTLKTHENKISIMPEMSGNNKGVAQEIDIDTETIIDEKLASCVLNEDSLQATIEIPTNVGENSNSADNHIATGNGSNAKPFDPKLSGKSISTSTPVNKMYISSIRPDGDSSVASEADAISTTAVEEGNLKRKRGRPPRNEFGLTPTSLSSTKQVNISVNSEDEELGPRKLSRTKTPSNNRNANDGSQLSLPKSVIVPQLQTVMDESLSNDFGSLKNNLNQSAESGGSLLNTTFTSLIDSVSDSDSNIGPSQPVRRGPMMRGGRYTRRRRGGRRGMWARGRRSAGEPVSNSSLTTESGTFQCSACQLSFDTRLNAKNHITSKHNGLARINDDTPFTEAEINYNLRNALKLKKYLPCLNEECGRFFRSALGYYNHSKMCGVEIKFKTCTICDEEVMEAKFDNHYRKHLRDDKKREIRESLAMSEGNADDDSQTDTPPIKKRTTRRAALMANSRLEEFVKAERIDEDGKEIIFDTDNEADEEIQPSEAEMKDNKDKDYAHEEETEKSAASSDASIDDISEKMSVYTQDWFRNKLEKEWSNNYTKPAKRPSVDIEQKKLWKKELQEFKYIRCKNEGCNKRLLSSAAAAKHQHLCGEDSYYVCLLCNESRPVKIRHVKKFYAHIIKHKKVTGTQSDVSGKTLGYKEFIQSIPEKKKRANLITKLEANPLLAKNTFNYCENHHSAEAFAGFRPLKSDWLLSNNPNDYLPEDSLSPNFKIQRLNDDCVSSWSKLKMFEVLQSKSEPVEHITLNAGGPIWACAWCPTPFTEANSKSIDQYAAVSISLEKDKWHKMNEVTKHKGLIQIWNFGNLDQKTFDSTPQLALAIGHNYGEIRDMKWCPSGCWDHPDEMFQSPEVLPRLGLLAVACGDGCIRVLSIPHPSSLPGKWSQKSAKDSLKIYTTHPVFLLNSPESGLVSNSHKTCCTSICFERTDGHGKLAAGYGNGLISLWDLRSNSPLIVACRRRPSSKGVPPLPQTLRPFHIFLAHSASVTSVTFSPVPNGRFLASSGLDKFCKIWDLDDTCVPIDSLRKVVAHDISWSCHWCGYFLGLDDCYNVNNVNSVYKECGYFDFNTLSVSHHNACVWKTSISEWLNCEASCDAAGTVNMTTLPFLCENINYLKSLKNHRWPIYTTRLCPLADISSVVSDSESQAPEKTAKKESMQNDPSLYLYNTHAKITEKYGLVYIDAPLSSYNQLSSPEARALTLQENMPQVYPGQYQIASVNHVSWNPNLGSHHWLLTAGQAGLVRLSCVSAIRVRTINRLLAKVTKDNERT